MKHTKKVDIPAQPATTKEVQDFISCDLCKDKIITNTFKADNVDIQCKTGDVYPEGGMGSTIEVDMCCSCFRKKLIPWLESQGAEPLETEWDY